MKKLLFCLLMICWGGVIHMTYAVSDTSLKLEILEPGSTFPAIKQSGSNSPTYLSNTEASIGDIRIRTSLDQPGWLIIDNPTLKELVLRITPIEPNEIKAIDTSTPLQGDSRATEVNVTAETSQEININNLIQRDDGELRNLKIEVYEKATGEILQDIGTYEIPVLNAASEQIQTDQEVKGLIALLTTLLGILGWTMMTILVAQSILARMKL